MAKMHPEDIEALEDATPGEKRVFRFLREAARPHADYTCWFEPQIGSRGKPPDFVLFGKRLGLVVVEVKDWESGQITAFNPLQFTLRVSGKEEKKTNPARQAKSYVDAIREKLAGFPEFLSEDPRYSGNVRIPIGRAVIFPNMTRKEYAESQFKWLLESVRVLVKDDLDPAGDILSDSSGKRFREILSPCLPFSFQGLSPKEIEKLGFVIWPERQITIPRRRGPGKARFREEVQALDDLQAGTALRLPDGNQIIKGPPGSGKTLVLIHRCRHLVRYGHGIRKILLVCYNIALVGYLKRLLQEKGLGVGEEGIHACHFFELCSRILGEPVHYENEDSEYYALVAQEALERTLQGKALVGPYDAVLIDEGQDFDEPMLRTLVGVLRPGGDLVICLDSCQDLYRRRFSWKSVGIQAAGRMRRLRRVYRNTSEIFDFTQRFIGESPVTGKQLNLLPDAFAFRAGPPEMPRLENDEDVEAFLIDDLKRSIDSDGYRRSEIAVIYNDKVYGPSLFAYDNRALPMRVLQRLETSGIPAAWVSRDVRSKEMYDITTDRVSVISIHSAKGLDFDLVYLMGMDRIRPSTATRDALVTLVYVAMTRAKYRLVIPWAQETELIGRMRNCLTARDEAQST